MKSKFNIGMKSNQWYIMSATSFILGNLLAYISMQSKLLGLVRGDIFAPFPYIFFTLTISFIICGGLENA